MTHEEFSQRFQSLFYDGADQIAAGAPPESVKYQTEQSARKLVQSQLDELDSRRRSLGRWDTLDEAGRAECLDVQAQRKSVDAHRLSLLYLLKWLSLPQCRELLDKTFSR